MEIRLTSAVVLFFATAPALAQNVWEIPFKDREIVIDGFIEEWKGVPEVVIRPDASGIQNAGKFSENDLGVTLRGLWDGRYLYVAVGWEDDAWDIKEVQRHEAVWISPDKRRRDRMFFFDNLKFHIHEADYDYIFWISPRVADQGPFSWQRLLEGLKGMETATAPPLVTPRLQDQTATLEILFLWRELKIKPKEDKAIPLTLMACDSDLPGRFLEGKLDHLKSLLWEGQLRLVR